MLAGNDPQVLTIDFETYYDQDYSLSKMTTEAYVRDERFEPLGAAVRGPSGYVEWFPAHQLSEFIENVDWKSIGVLCHHTQFDGLILAHHYGVKPALWLDTLSMARLVHGAHIRVGLDKLAVLYGMQNKSIPYHAFRGRFWDELSGLVQDQLAAGSRHDVKLTWALFELLLPQVPVEEMQLIDLTVRMFTEPCLRGNVALLHEIIKDERSRKALMMEALGVSSRELQSAERFAQLLRIEGIEPPTKETEAGRTYCFAKTDTFMTDLLEHPDDRTRTLAEARLGVRSTLDETRATRIADMSARGAVPVYLAFSGAHTHRWAGGDKVNLQNLKRGSRLRSALQAPPGHVIIKADKSQIECRFLNYLAGQDDVIERFRKGEDPYVGIATQAYGVPVRKPKAGEADYSRQTSMRGTGKQLELSCGYGAGTLTIQSTAAKGTYGPPVRITVATAQEWRDLYRRTHPKVVQFWAMGDQVLHALARGTSVKWSIFQIDKHRLWLPNDTWLEYPDLHLTTDDKGRAQWVYKSRHGNRRIWGGFLTENLIQAVSRVDMGQAMLRIREAGLHIALMEHDAVAVVVEAKEAQDALDLVLKEMRRAPAWCPDIPLDAEATLGEAYS